MAITHADVKATGDKGYASEWNKDHVVDDDSKPKNFTTLIVAASNSLDTTRADYVCDGIDDEEEINDAIAALPAGGGRVSLMEGTYQITDTINLAGDNVTLQGLGFSSVIQTTENIRMIESTNHHGLLVKDIRIYGPGAGHAANFGLFFDGCDYFLIDGCYFHNCGVEGIYVENCNKAFIVNTTSQENIRGGIVVSSSTYVTISTSDASRNLEWGIWISGGVGCVVDACSVTENVAWGVRLSGGSIHNVVSNSVIFNNDVNDTASDVGVEIQSASHFNVITGNTISNNDEAEIKLNVGATGNIIVANDLTGDDRVAVIVDGGTRTQIAHNVTEDTADLPVPPPPPPF